MLFRRAVPLVAALLALGAAPAPAPAAEFAAHDHARAGANWHVQVDVAKGARRIPFVVLYVEQCAKTTVFEEDVAVGRDGRFTVGDVGVARWRISGRIEGRTVTGTFRLARDACETGRTAFTAVRGAGVDPADEGTAGDGHVDHTHNRTHTHGANGSAHTGGHALGTYPDLAKATPAEIQEAETLWYRSRFSARKRFATYSDARHKDYVRNRSERLGRPVLFHLSSYAMQRDGLVLEPKAPESLVFWLGRTGPPKLIGFMYRAPAGAPPLLAGPLLTWHAHVGRTGRLGQTQMTHVWLTDDLRSALAGCLPVEELEASVPGFEFAPPFREVGDESTPCARDS